MGEPDLGAVIIAGENVVTGVKGEYAADAKRRGVMGDADATVRPGVGGDESTEECPPTLACGPEKSLATDWTVSACHSSF